MTSSSCYSVYLTNSQIQHILYLYWKLTVHMVILNNSTVQLMYDALSYFRQNQSNSVQYCAAHMNSQPLDLLTDVVGRIEVVNVVVVTEAVVTGEVEVVDEVELVDVDVEVMVVDVEVDIVEEKVPGDVADFDRDVVGRAGEVDSVVDIVAL